MAAWIHDDVHVIGSPPNCLDQRKRRRSSAHRPRSLEEQHATPSHTASRHHLRTEGLAVSAHCAFYTDSMDGNSSQGSLEKFLPRALAAKRRRNKANSLAETASSTDDVASLRGKGGGSIASQDEPSTTEAQAQARDTISNGNGHNIIDEKVDAVSYDSDPE